MPEDDAAEAAAGQGWVVSRDEAEQARQVASRGKRQQKTWYVTEDVAYRVNAAVFWAAPKALEQDPDLDPAAVPDSASALVETALWAEVLRLEKLYNNGEPFPPPKSGRLRSGPGRQGVERLREPRRKK